MEDSYGIFHGSRDAVTNPRRGIFTLAQNVVDGSAGIISGSMDLNLALTDLATELEAMGTGELLGLYLESAIMRLAIQAMSLCIFIIAYGRMLEIFLVISVAPIPLSTMVNREWGSIGSNYIAVLRLK